VCTEVCPCEFGAETVPANKKIRGQLSSFELEPKSWPGSEIGERHKADRDSWTRYAELTGRGVRTGKPGRNDGGRSTGGLGTT
jgi:hypothetical protein